MVPLPDARDSNGPSAARLLCLPMNACRAGAAAIVLAAVWASGCGRSQESPPPGPSIQRIDAAGLPALGEYEPPLDGGRIGIAGPKGWKVAPRYGDYVIRFQVDAEKLYPMILVTAEDFSGEALTPETIEQFARQPDVKGARPVAIGDRLGSLYLKHGKDPNSIDQILDRLLWTGVLSGRRYTLELRARQGETARYENALFAVAAGLKPLDAGGDEPAGEGSKRGPAKKGEKAAQAPAAGSVKEKKPAEPEDPGLKELDKLFK